MSEQLRHKMIDFEAMPPHVAWTVIAERLDDDKQYAAVATKMNNFDALPPQVAWTALAERLDDDKQYAAVATKMNNFDAPPPPQTWDNIAASLQETKEATTPVINIRRLVYRVAAAAIIIGLFIGGWMLTNRNTATNIEVVKNSNIPAPARPAAKEENKTIATNNNSNQKEEVVAAAQNNVKNHSPLSASTSDDNNNNDDRVLKYAVVSGLPAHHENSIVVSSSPILDKDGNVIRDMDVLTTSSNYLLVMGPNGQVTRISSKFASVIRYLNGSNSNDSEEYLDKVIKESDTWKKRFQEWRSKISQSSFIPSSANFLDIVEFKELIQEKQ